MKTVLTLYNQTLIDIAMQELGDVERVYELCMLNDLPLTVSLAPGTPIICPDFAQDRRRVVRLFSNQSLAPASIDNNEDLPNLPPGGIGFMQIGNDFIAS